MERTDYNVERSDYSVEQSVLEQSDHGAKSKSLLALVLILIDSKSCGSFLLNQPQSVVKQNQSKRNFLKTFN